MSSGALPGPRHDPGPRRFEATRSASRRLWLILLGVQLGLAIVAAVGVQLLPPGALRVAGPVFVFVLLAGYLVWMVQAIRPRRVVLEAGSGQVVVDGGRGGAYPVAGGALGPWQASHLGVTQGTVLHLSDGARSLRIGGQDHRPPPWLSLTAQPVAMVDVFLPAPVFEDLLQHVLGARPEGHAGAAAAPHAVRCPLLPNPSSARGVLRVMLPWIGTIVAVTVIGGTLGQTALFQSRPGQTVMMVFLGALVVCGLVATMVLANRRRPALFLEIDAREVRLGDASGRIVAAAPRAHTAVLRCVYHMRTRWGTYEYPQIIFAVPGHPPVPIGVMDLRFRWLDTAEKGSTPAYLIGPPDFLSLVDALGVRPSLGVQEQGHWG